MKQTLSSNASIKRHLAVGLLLVFVLLFGVGGWASNAPLAGAVVTSGTLVVDSYVKHVQHLTGGTIASLHVKNGDQVGAGQIVATLDDTQTKANLSIVEKRLADLRTREARLLAELNGSDRVEFPTEGLDDAGIARIDSERRLFNVRRTSRAGLKAQLNERIAQLRNEIIGIKSQIEGNERALDLVSMELADLKPLFDKGVIPASRINPLKREEATLASDLGATSAQLAKARGQIAEIELQKLQIGEDLFSEAASEIRDVQQQIGENVERLVAARDELGRSRILSPQEGVVHGLSVHSAGAVISAGERILSVVPVSDELVVEVNVRPQDIDQIKFGQTAKLRFSAFNSGTTPEIIGAVESISPDLSYDERTGTSSYIVRISVTQLETQRLGKVELVPGMPVEAFVETRPRTALTYLIKPLRDQIERAFKEE